MLVNNNSQKDSIDKNSFFTTKFIDPESIVNQMDLKAGMKVADFGCGGGYFTLPIAEKIGDGTVYAFDVVTQKLEAVESQARMRGLNNILIKRVNLENPNGSGLEDREMDWVVIKDMLFQNKGKNQIFEEASRILKVGGKILIIEWKLEDSAIGPSKELRMYKESLIELAKKVGLKFTKNMEVGDFHYGLILEK